MQSEMERAERTMKRRTFLQLTAAAGLPARADEAMPMATLGKSGLRVSRFCLGGYHMAVRGEETPSGSSTGPSSWG